jgi:AcrR family transcriptional regulator
MTSDSSVLEEPLLGERQPEVLPEGVLFPRRHFQQRRAEATYLALLDAAERVFSAEGFDGAQSPAIAAEAGVSTGAFYRYFRNKRQVLLEVIGRKLQKAHDEVLTRLDEALVGHRSLAEAIAAAIVTVFRTARGDAALERVYLALSLTDPEVGALRARFEQLSLERLAVLIEVAIPREVAPDPRAAALVLQVSAIEVAQVAAGLRPPLVGEALSEEAVRQALTDFVLRYLRLA